MLPNVNDYFKHVDNFRKISHVKSELILGKHNHNIPIVSIVIPTFKRGELIIESIQSCINQDGFTDYEIIVVDNDHESDSLLGIISSLQNHKLLYFRNDNNLGMFGNWNRAFEIARSPWIVMLHDDDIISPYFLKHCSFFLKDKSIGCIKPQSETFSSNLTILKKPINPKYGVLKA